MGEPGVAKAKSVDGIKQANDTLTKLASSFTINQE